jgi:hypothetical protein
VTTVKEIASFDDHQRRALIDRHLAHVLTKIEEETDQGTVVIQEIGVTTVKEVHHRIQGFLLNEMEIEVTEVEGAAMTAKFIKILCKMRCIQRLNLKISP